MDKGQEIRTILKKMASEVGPTCTLLGKIQNIRANEKLCDLYDEDSQLEFFDVRLVPVIVGDEGLTLIPKEGAWGFAIRIEDSEDWMLLSSGEIEKYDLKVSEASLSADKVTFNGGENGGLIKIEELKTELNKYNQLLQSFIAILQGAPIPEAGNGSPSALQTALAGAITGKQLPTFNQIENDKIKH